MKHELPAALVDLDRALELDPSGARTYQDRAYARQLSNDNPGALADATKAIELEPQLAGGRARTVAATNCASDERRKMVSVLEARVRSEEQSVFFFSCRVTCTRLVGADDRGM